jgi:hypothetical protein
MQPEQDNDTQEPKNPNLLKRLAIANGRRKKAEQRILTLQAELDELRLRPEPLNIPEKRFVALAIQSVCNRQGPAAWPMTKKIIEKLAIQDYLDEHLRNWIAHSTKEGESNE